MPGEIEKALLRRGLWAPGYPEALEAARLALRGMGAWLPPLKEAIQYHEERGEWIFYLGRFEGGELEVEAKAKRAARVVRELFRQRNVYMPVYVRLHIAAAWVAAGLGH